jgi:hypothetical protein
LAGFFTAEGKVFMIYDLRFMIVNADSASPAASKPTKRMAGKLRRDDIRTTEYENKIMAR